MPGGMSRATLARAAAARRKPPPAPTSGMDGGLRSRAQQAAVQQYLQAAAAQRQPQRGPSDSSGGGPYYEAPPPPAPSYDPNTDPAYQALLRAIGVQEDEARRVATARQGETERQAAEVTPRIAEKGQEERRGIDSSFESRGLFRGGERLRRLGLQQQQEQQRVGDVQRDTTNRVQEIQRALQSQINDLARQRADAALNASYRAAR